MFGMGQVVDRNVGGARPRIIAGCYQKRVYSGGPWDAATRLRAFLSFVSAPSFLCFVSVLLVPHVDDTTAPPRRRLPPNANDATQHLVRPPLPPPRPPLRRAPDLHRTHRVNPQVPHLASPPPPTPTPQRPLNYHQPTPPLPPLQPPPLPQPRVNHHPNHATGLTLQPYHHHIRPPQPHRSLQHTLTTTPPPAHPGFRGNIGGAFTTSLASLEVAGN